MTFPPFFCSNFRCLRVRRHTAAHHSGDVVGRIARSHIAATRRHAGKGEQGLGMHQNLTVYLDAVSPETATLFFVILASHDVHDGACEPSSKTPQGVHTDNARRGSVEIFSELKQGGQTLVSSRGTGHRTGSSIHLAGDVHTGRGRGAAAVVCAVSRTASRNSKWAVRCFVGNWCNSRERAFLNFFCTNLSNVHYC